MGKKKNTRGNGKKEKSSESVTPVPTPAETPAATPAETAAPPATPVSERIQFASSQKGSPSAGDRPREQNSSPSKSERNLTLAGPPITPDKAILKSSLVSPKLRTSMSPKDLEETFRSPPIPQYIIDGANALVEKRSAQLVQAYRKIKLAEVEHKCDLEQVTTQIAALDGKYRDGSIDITGDDYRKERERCLRRQLELMKMVSVMRTMSSQIAGRFADDLTVGSRENLDDWAYIDAVVRCYPELKDATQTVKSKRTPQKESKFRKELIKAYDTTMDGKSYKLWCPITAGYVVGAVAVAAHIIDVSVGEKTVQALFGNDKEHIWSVKNGLIIDSGYEKLLDTAKAVILPVSDNPGETEFEFYLLSSDLGRQRSDIWNYSDLHRRRLQFKNDFRPSKRYLYFKYTMSLLRRRRAEVPGHLEDLANLPSFAKTLWASPGTYMKRSILYKFSRQLGCITPDEADRFWGVSEAPVETLSAEDEDLAETRAVLASTSISEHDAEALNLPGEDESSDEGGVLNLPSNDKSSDESEEEDGEGY